MYVKCVLFLIILGFLNAYSYGLSRRDSCRTPRISNGQVHRVRPRSKLAKFTCQSSFELVGNKYATCRDGRWDVPIPVCVRASCPIPDLLNGLRMISHGGGWVIFFCFPGYELVGSHAIYCDGVRWNASVPSCVDTTTPTKLSCDFEDANICGWTQDNLHDFDWRRLNSKTPSSFLLTGPSYDHTLGKGQYGYYMYIESTSQLENETARLISPIYDSSLTSDGCFSFAYHMYGRTTGGLRVYQKPDNVTLRRMLDLSEDEKQNYVLFEKWGDHGDVWLTSVSSLRDFKVDFQIVIEGIRGRSFTSDIAIDDVAILQGENCTNAIQAATTPATPLVRHLCVNRCDKPRQSQGECGCTLNCMTDGDCCPDFFDVCFEFLSETTTPDTNVSVTLRSSSEEAPQTLKLVAVTTTSTSTSTTITPEVTATTFKSTTTAKPTTRKPTTQPTTTSTTSTTKTTPTTTTSTTARLSTTPKRIVTTNPSTKRTTTYKPSTTTIKTSTKSRVTKTEVTPLRTTKPAIKTSPTSYRVSKPMDNDNYLDTVGKAKKEQMIENRRIVPNTVKTATQPGGMSTGAKVFVVFLVLALCSVIGLAAIAGLRSPRGQLALARLRGRQSRDAEVRYMIDDVDDN